MANSFSFDGIDMSTYGLTVQSTNLPDLSKDIPTIQLIDRAYAGTATRTPKTLTINATVEGVSVSDLYNKLDSIKQYLDIGEAHFILDSLTDRYYNAELTDISGNKVSNTVWGGMLTFLCADPLAYSTTETSSDYNITTDPKTIVETVGGTGYVNPVFTLTAGETLSSVTILVNNLTTDEELSWEGSLVSSDELEIDVEHWIVYKNSAASMSTVTGQFPRLAPGANSIKVTGLSTTGTLNITYRDTFL